MGWEREDSFGYSSLEIGLIEVELGFVLVCMRGLEQVELVINSLHLGLPVFVMVVALCPEE